MKKCSVLFAFACLLSWSVPVWAQSNKGTAPAQNASSPALEKNSKATPASKKPAAAEFAGEVKTDNTGRQYKTIDGRKVLVDNQGVQSLAAPATEPAIQQPETKSKRPKK